MLAGATPVLVHNCDDGDLVSAVQGRYNEITDPNSSGYQSIRQRGPVLTGVKDRLTGDVKLGQNGGDFPNNLHPSLAARLEGDGADGWYPGSSGVHGEIHALNDLLWGREAAGLSTEIDDSFVFYSMRLRGSAQGQQILRCGSCFTLTGGADELG
ncbi:YwqJ-related putative deaminase [Streptomyces sp. NPDC046985]|uniref:YwqJ-related putative deaminase n=1 Tax=Streptomyces sp. NPDC046985 TaxID=3155377 RepID=UPI0033D59E1D